MLAHRLKKSKPAFRLLTILGSVLLFITAAILIAGCFLIYHDNFQDSTGLKEKIEIQFDYSHFWLAGSVCITYLSIYLFLIYLHKTCERKHSLGKYIIFPAVSKMRCIVRDT